MGLKRLFSLIKVLLVSLILVFSSFSYALEGQGKILQIKSCGTGQPDNLWISYVFFKLSDDNWFGIYANRGSGDYDSNFRHSLLLTAFSMDLDVEVSATYSVITTCGTTANMLWNNVDDYLNIVR